MRSSKTWRSAALRIAAAALAAVLFACSQAQLGPRAALEAEKPREDALPQPPAYPKPENLVRIETGGAGSFEFFIDAVSIEVLGKGEFRYTLLARSSAAAINISYEGLRCLTRERRLYAFGRPDGSWAPAKKSEWTEFSRTQYSQIPVILSQDYLCPERTPVLSVQQAVQALRYGGRQDPPLER